MKKLLFIFSCIVITSALHAQVSCTEKNCDKLWVAFNGGGAISKFVTTSHALTAAFSFDAPDGTSPYYSAMMQASDGKLYGTTTYGGSSELGCYLFAQPCYKYLYGFMEL